MTSHTLFNDKSELYEAARPVYPEAIYQYLSKVAPSNFFVWGCACGNGQAAYSLVRYFNKVAGTDVSQQQIANAKNHPRVEYTVSPSEHTEFPDNSFDLVCVAQALHWFDFDAFWPEVKRVLKPEGVFSAWGYTWPGVSPEIDKVFTQAILNIVEPYWAPQNRLLWNHYEDIDFPFDRLNVPQIEMQIEWSLDEFFNFIQTFSATRRCVDDIGESFLKRAYVQLKEVWVNESAKKLVNLEFVFYAGIQET